MAFGFIQKFLGRIGDFFAGLLGSAARLAAWVREKAHLPRFDFSGWAASHPRALVLAGGGAALVVVVCVVVTLALLPKGRGRDGSLEGLFGAAVPGEGFFLPDEPDFLPTLLLERERRDAWGPEDAEPFWIDPLEEGPELYGEIVRRVLDGVMERVP